METPSHRRLQPRSYGPGERQRELDAQRAAQHKQSEAVDDASPSTDDEED